MSKKPKTVELNTSLADIHSIFEKNNFHHIPVLKNGKLAGIVSHTDYLKVVRNVFDNKNEDLKNRQLMASMLASDVMTTEVETLLETETIGDAMTKFKNNTFHAIPVVNEDMRLKGIVTTYDLLLQIERKLMEEENAITN